VTVERPRDSPNRSVEFRPMLTLLALSEAWKVSIALIVVFGIVFPALATGLIAFAAAQAAAERRQNNERRAAHGR
jgi:uncharacterized protein (DUF2062 family)